ncbi:spore germination protein [Fictibacillus sp. KIGAM418]|uniref:Spore germination protein n=1 Tax=Fictibacillus marinisediminis TaxID=2878389 RepID=A0A9X1XFF5_9BACL|nr:spore germination protein [Fictibacillus marinisediminis]MCK6256574.1 spore germination protein [Fictibacillus marinisediminis]
MKIRKRLKRRPIAGSEAKAYENIEVSLQIDENLDHLKNILGESMDVKILPFYERPVPFVVCFIEGLVNKQQIDLSILQPIHDWQDTEEDVTPQTLIQQIEVSAVVNKHQLFGHIITPILKGQVAVFVDGLDVAYTIPLEFFPTRGIDEPESQTTVRGPREGFIETLQINTTLLRRRISNPLLRFKPLQIGNVTKTTVLVAYMENKADLQVLNEVMNRLINLDTDKVFEGGMIEELIDENGYTPFPTFQSSERPDVAAAALAEGKIVILIEGTPFVLITPVTFISFFQAAEDYYSHYDLSILVRFVRVMSFIISFSLPAVYIAVTSFHQELIPTNLLVSLAAQREGVPFPAFLEALIMEIIFEILREAGIRMPRPIGSAVSIVGAIVIGESAVAAGLVSPAIVIVVSLTAISSFVSPYYAFSGAARILRFALMILAATIGIYGIIMFYLALFVHLCSLTSMGKPYFTSLAPFTDEQDDTLLRLPFWWKQTKLYKKWKASS